MKIEKRKVVLLFVIYFLACVAIGFTYQPPDGYEMDPVEIAWYLCELAHKPEMNQDQIEKFEVILLYGLEDDEEYDAHMKKRAEDGYTINWGISDYPRIRPDANLED